MHSEANTRARIDGKLDLSREESDAIHARRPKIMEGENKFPP